MRPRLLSARLLRCALGLAALALVPACALTTDQTEVVLQPPGRVAPVAGATEVSLAVTAQDRRSTPPNRISVKRNGYGMEMAPILATNDVLAETRRAAVAALEGRGFAVQEAGATGRNGEVRLELSRFFADFRLGFWSGSAVAEIIATLRVADPSGGVTYSRSYRAEYILSEVMIISGENARIALSAALTELLRQIREDEGLTRALLALRAPPAPAAPVASDRSPAQRGRPAA